MLAVVPMYRNRYHRFNTALHDALEGVVDTTHLWVAETLAANSDDVSIG